MDDQSLLTEISALKNEIQQLKYEKGISTFQDSNFHKSQVRFRTIFESSMLGNKIISPDLKILQLNQAMVALLGYDTKDEIIGTRILDYTPTEHLEDWKILQDNLWKNSMPSFGIETCLRKKDGTLFWCQVTSILFKDQNQNYGYTIIEDCTERHDLRRQKEEFISVASHQLNTPITSLKARLQVMNRMLGNENDVSTKFRKLSQEAETYTTKLGYLVGDLLNLTKIELEDFPLNRTKFVLSDVIDGCCSHINLQAEYTIKFKGDHKLKVVADIIKVDQILINLVNNAVKYAPDSKEIEIEVKQLDNMAKVLVTDKGQGISADHMANLFTRYYRVDKDMFKTSGLGLGLYVSSEIIKRHGGDMGVESEIGKGSTFWFTLPLN
ncbi:MAG: hypothetical protein JWN56_2983 [Sphingobacteriales bacterium]|nr:hypothetical protein [Sphingobacteriales bacterium]